MENQNAGPRIPLEYKPLSPWAYMGYRFLFMVPIIGFIFIIIFSFSDKNINRKKFARSFLCAFLIGLIVGILVFIFALVMGFAAVGTIN